VVDDGSTDGTPDVAEENGALVARSLMNVGGGHALQVGFAAARRLGARWVVTLDADGQHQPAELPLLLAPLLRGEADVVVGSRHLGQSVGHERTRALGLRIFNALLSFLLGRRITDCSSGYRAFDLEKLRTLRLVQDRHHTAELLIEAARNGLRIVEVGIVISPRRSGESKKGTNWRYGVRFARTVAQAWWG
jgi:glycosyltransferase involved in cell wall biosynthesis